MPKVRNAGGLGVDRAMSKERFPKGACGRSARHREQKRDGMVTVMAPRPRPAFRAGSTSNRWRRTARSGQVKVKWLQPRGRVTWLISKGLRAFIPRFAIAAEASRTMSWWVQFPGRAFLEVNLGDPQIGALGKACCNHGGSAFQEIEVGAVGFEGQVVAGSSPYGLFVDSRWLFSGLLHRSSVTGGSLRERARWGCLAMGDRLKALDHPESIPPGAASAWSHKRCLRTKPGELADMTRETR